MTQAPPQRKCRKLVEGGGSVLGYPCDIRPEEHAGPCAAVELPRSMEARARWETARQAEAFSAATQAMAPTIAPVLPHEPAERVNYAATGNVPVLAAGALLDEADRVQALQAMLHREPASLPTPVRDWVMAMLAYTSLSTLWRLAMVEFDNGATAVTITPDLLERLVPSILRPQLGITGK